MQSVDTKISEALDGTSSKSIPDDATEEKKKSKKK